MFCFYGGDDDDTDGGGEVGGADDGGDKVGKEIQSLAETGVQYFQLSIEKSEMKITSLEQHTRWGLVWVRLVW